MKRSIKIMLGIILTLVVIFGITLAANGDLFQGRLSLRSKPLPAHDETKNQQTRNKILPAYDETKTQLNTLVIVDTDDYKITEKDVTDLFKLASDIYLKPKTGITFNVTGIKFASFSEGNLNFSSYLDEEYAKNQESKSNLPEYIVAFDKNEVTNEYGGYKAHYVIYWLIDDLENGQKINYCNKFPSKYIGGQYPSEISIPAAVVDYGHRYAICGYDTDGITIISNTSINGQCINQEGIPCISKNGYQMCSNLQNAFYAQNLLYYSAKTIVHELMHNYGENGEGDHFGTNTCKENMGEKEFQDILNKTPIAPFDSVTKEYADMCPNVWQNFLNSKQNCL